MRKIIMAVLVVVTSLVLVMTGCAQPAAKEVTVGNKNFTEEYIIGQLLKQVLEEHGFTVNLVSDLSTMALREGMEAGDIDICADYTGTAWMTRTPVVMSPCTAVSTLCQSHSLWEISENSPGIRHGGYSTSWRTLPISATATWCRTSSRFKQRLRDNSSIYSL